MRQSVILLTLLALSFASCTRGNTNPPPVEPPVASGVTESLVLPAEVQDALATPAAESGSDSETVTGSGVSMSGSSATNMSGSTLMQSGSQSSEGSQGVITTIERSDTGASAGDTTISPIK